MSRQVVKDLERSSETALAAEVHPFSLLSRLICCNSPNFCDSRQTASSHTLSHFGLLSVALSNLTSLIAQQTDIIAVNLARSGRASTHWVQEGIISGVLRLLRSALAQAVSCAPS